MPLRALVNEEEVVAPLISESDWGALKQRVRGSSDAVRLPCCDAPGFLRTSKLGTRHFVHKRAGGCHGSGETMQHLWAKAEVLKACADAGWQARPEVVGDGWRADVLAERGKARVAVEVQWSRQDQDVSRFRQDRYAASGVRACWLLRGEQPETASKELPVFEMRAGTDDPVSVWHHGQEFTVREFVRMLLEGQVRFAATTVRRVRVQFLELECWRCHKPSHVFQVSEKIGCGYQDSEWREPGDWDRAETFDDDTLLQVYRWHRETGSSAGVRLGEIKIRSGRTMESSYMSFGCPFCDALFGRWFLDHELFVFAEPDDFTHRFEFERPYQRSRPQSDDPGELEWLAKQDAQQAHWCLPADGHYCGDHAHAARHRQLGRAA